MFQRIVFCFAVELFCLFDISLTNKFSMIPPGGRVVWKRTLMCLIRSGTTPALIYIGTPIKTWGLPTLGSGSPILFFAFY